MAQFIICLSFTCFYHFLYHKSWKTFVAVFPFCFSCNFALTAMKLHTKTMLLIVIYPLEAFFPIFFLFQCFSQIFCWTALSAAMQCIYGLGLWSNRIEMHNDKIKLCANVESKAQDDCFLNLGIVIIVMFDALK